MRLRGAFAAILLVVACANARAAHADSAPQISVFPPSIRVGGSGALEVQVTSAGKPALRALAGSVSEPARLGDVWIAKYLPRDDANAPGWDLIFAEADGAVGVASIELVKRTNVPVAASKAVSELTVKVAGRRFGPFAGGADEVQVEVEIPPGAREIEVTASVPGLRPLVSTEPLALPPLKRVFLTGPAKAKRGRAFTVRAVVLDRQGRISLSPPRVEAQGNASIGAPVAAGPGVWTVRVVPHGGRVVLNVRGEGARGRLAVAVPAAPRATPTPDPTPTPAPAVAQPPIPPAPTCEELAVTPGEITTSTGLKDRIDAALDERDPVRRRDRFVELHCLFPEEHSVRLQLTASWLLLGDHERTIELAQPLIADEEEIHDDHRALALSYLAAAELRTGDADGAIRDARAAESLLPGLYSATYTLGEAYYVKKDFGQALAALLSAYRAAPGFASAVDHVILARLLESRGDRAEAAHHALAAARMEPNEEQNWREAARLAESSGRWARAYEAWRVLSASTLPGFTANTESHAAATRATVAAARDPEIMAVESALAAERASDLPRAVATLRALLERHRGNVAARWNLARILHVQGKHDEAATEVFALLNAMPDWVPALILAGDVERGRGAREKAFLFYAEAAGVEPPAPMSPVARWRLSALAEADTDAR